MEIRLQSFSKWKKSSGNRESDTLRGIQESKWTHKGGWPAKNGKGGYKWKGIFERGTGRCTPATFFTLSPLSCMVQKSGIDARVSQVFHRSRCLLNALFVSFFFLCTSAKVQRGVGWEGGNEKLLMDIPERENGRKTSMLLRESSFSAAASSSHCSFLCVSWPGFLS